MGCLDPLTAHTHTFWTNCPKAWQRLFKGKELQAAMTRSERFAELKDVAENRRLHKALMDKFNVE
jgi:hypothetical protein